MFSPNRIRLFFAIALLTSLLTALAETVTPGHTTTANPLKAKLLRRHDKTKLPPTTTDVASMRKQTLQKEERELEDAIPKHVPIKVKIKKEKEKSFKDIDNQRWLRDLEIEVTNTGTKPIYFLDLRLLLPDTIGPDSNMIGWPLLYGRSDLVEVTEPLRPTDVPINPGESHIFTIAESYVSAWEHMEEERVVTQPKRAKVLLQLISFGDGTGFWGGTAAPLPHRKKASRAAPCVDDENFKYSNRPRSRLAAWILDPTVFSRTLPAFVPANFLVPDRASPITIDAGNEPDICCPGTSCTWAKQTFTRCQCSPIDDPEINDAPSVTFPSCSDSSGECSTITYSTRWCDFPMGDGQRPVRLSCSVPFVFFCGDFAPPPPPPPSPTPASPTPTPSPLCPLPTPEPGCDPNWVPIWSWLQCRWSCLPPQPDPTPPPDPGGGYYCTPYFWVWYISYDGGQTWEETGMIEYAGCW